MLNRKIIFVLIVFICCLNACKISTIAFDGDKNIDTSFFRKVTSLWGNPRISGYEKIVVYKAVLQEELTDRDDIPEYKLVNTESTQPLSSLQGQKNYNELYLCQVITGRKKDTLCVFLASGFNYKRQCTKLGPAYLGVIHMDEISMRKKLKIENSNGQYFIADATAATIRFYAEKNIPVAYEELCNADNPDDTLCKIHIREIINSNINKIGGKKPVIFSTQKIFNDPRALVFTYYTTLKH